MRSNESGQARGVTSTDRSGTKRRVVGAAVATPVLMAMFAAPASAAELAPVAEAVDGTVVGLSSSVGGAVDALGFEA